MFEKVLQAGETIEKQEDCTYCGDGAMAAVKNGAVALTNKRLIVCKKKTTVLGVVLGIVFGLAGMAIYWAVTDRIGGAIGGAIIGLGVGVGMMIGMLISKGKTADSADYSIERDNIESVEDGSRGVRKMLVIKTKDGNICKIGVKDKEAWRAAMTKQ